MDFKEIMGLERYLGLDLLSFSMGEEDMLGRSTLDYGELSGLFTGVKCVVRTRGGSYVSQSWHINGARTIDIDTTDDSSYVRKIIPLNTTVYFCTHMVQEVIDGVTYDYISFYEHNDADYPVFVLVRHPSGLYVPIYGETFSVFMYHLTNEDEEDA